MKKQIILNWKMNGDKDYANYVSDYLDSANIDNEKYQIIICPPYTLFKDFKSNIILAGQNCSSYETGSYTGEISATMLSESGCKYIILGHSERRKYFHENTDNILQKMDMAIKASIIPIMCVHRFFDDCDYINLIVSNFYGKNSLSEMIVAYEPSSAIGSGIADSVYAIEDNLLKIKEVILSKNLPCDKKIHLIYGGSVNSENIKSILSISDGVLIGKASIEKEEFKKIISRL